MQSSAIRAALKAGAFAVSVMCVGAASTASANDLRVSGNAAAPSWTGFYAGVNAGYGWSSETANYTGIEPTFYAPTVGVLTPGLGTQIPGSMNAASKGFLGGIQAGYNYQIDRTVLGLEADFSGSTMHGSNSYNFVSNNLAVSNLTTTQETKLDWLSTLRGRAGYLITPSLLPFVSAGLAVGKAVTSTSTIPTGNSFGGTDNCIPNDPGSSLECSTGSSASTLVGWAAGGGIEAAIARNWSMKAEYLHYDLGSVSYTDKITASPGLIGTPAMQTNTNVRGDIVRIGLNYLFN